MAAPKSVSVLYAAGDEDTRRQIAVDLHEAVKGTLEYLDSLAGTARRGSASGGTIEEIGTDGLVAIAFMHDQARPTGDCRCGDPHLHEHVITMNSARGADGEWSAIQNDRIAPNARTAGFLFQAELRDRLAQSLGVQWRPVTNGVAEVAGISDESLRRFSKRKNEIEAELAEAGEEGAVAANVAQKGTRQAKRPQLPLEDRVAIWQTEAAEVGLTPEAAADVLGRSPEARHVDRDSREYGAAVLAGLTAEASSFTRSDVLRALAADSRQGARRAELEDRVDRILADPGLTVPLAEGEAGLTRADVRRAVGGRVYAYQVGARWSTPAQLQLEARLMDAAASRVGEGCARLDLHLVDAVVQRQPFVLSQEQADAVRGITTSGNGVDVLAAGAGSGKTSGVASVVRAAYQASGYRVIGAATSARAARVLEQDGGLEAGTIARLLLDLQRAPLAARTVLVLDEGSMIGSRDLAPLLEHAQTAGAKVVLVGDDRQLAAIDSGGGFRGLRDRLGCWQLTANRRQHNAWERTALEDLAAGRPGQALRLYTANDRVTVTDTSLGARRAMVTAWWTDSREHGLQRALMCAVRNVDRTELNRLGRQLMREAGQLGTDTIHAAGRDFSTGDRVLLLSNSASKRYDNGDLATVAGITERRDVVVELDRGGQATLNANYLAAGNLDHAYCQTIFKAQGSTVEVAHVLGVGLAKESGLVGLSRARASTRLYLTEGETQEPELDLPLPQQRSAFSKAAKSLSESQAKTLALDNSLHGADAQQLSQTLSEAAALLRQRPPADAARLPALQAQLRRLEEAGTSPERLAAAREAVDAVQEGRTERDKWQTQHEPELVGAVAAGRELAWRGKAEERAAEAVEPVQVPDVGLEPPTRSQPALSRRLSRN